ncbi:hypothetical protein IWX90DRAFT_45355 [Phyllosticta citrichinensis]|uniref:Transmembrane protein n=1 Tax=Phyllosticta citrichinensis TaxID=1130410 RepID=A0ABR1XI20_9PEZI
MPALMGGIDCHIPHGRLFRLSLHTQPSHHYPPLLHITRYVGLSCVGLRGVCNYRPLLLSFVFRPLSLFRAIIIPHSLSFFLSSHISLSRAVALSLYPIIVRHWHYAEDQYRQSHAGMLAKDSYTPPPLPLSLSSLFGFPNISTQSHLLHSRHRAVFLASGRSRLAPHRSVQLSCTKIPRRDGARRKTGERRTAEFEFFRLFVCLLVCSPLLSLMLLSFSFLPFLFFFFSFLAPFAFFIVVVFGVYAWLATVFFEFAPVGHKKGGVDTVARKTMNGGVQEPERRREHRRSRDRSGLAEDGRHEKEQGGRADKKRVEHITITSTPPCTHVTRARLMVCKISD